MFNRNKLNQYQMNGIKFEFRFEHKILEIGYELLQLLKSNEI